YFERLASEHKFGGERMASGDLDSEESRGGVNGWMGQEKSAVFSFGRLGSAVVQPGHDQIATAIGLDVEFETGLEAGDFHGFEIAGDDAPDIEQRELIALPGN